MDKKQIKINATRALERLYERYKDDGLLAIYFYGSITGPDFRPTISDIDTISIWENNQANLKKTEAVLNNFLVKQPEFIPGLGTRLLPIQELLDPSIKESPLTFFIPNEALILDLPYWELVIGQDISHEEIPEISHKVGVETGFKVLEKWNWLTNDTVELNKINNYLKVLARILWSLDGMSGIYYPFSYTKLAARSDEHLSIAQKILECKKLDWSESYWNTHRKEFQNFVDQIHSLETIKATQTP